LDLQVCFFLEQCSDSKPNEFYGLVAFGFFFAVVANPHSLSLDPKAGYFVKSDKKNISVKNITQIYLTKYCNIHLFLLTPPCSLNIFIK
jgi:hypothetical protein